MLRCLIAACFLLPALCQTGEPVSPSEESDPLIGLLAAVKSAPKRLGDTPLQQQKITRDSILTITIAYDIRKALLALFKAQTAYDAFEKDMLEIDYQTTFPEESEIIGGIGTVIADFLHSSQKAVKRVQKAAQEGISKYMWREDAVKDRGEFDYFDGEHIPIERDNVTLTLGDCPVFGIPCNKTNSVISVTTDVYSLGSNVLNFAKATRAMDDVFRQNMNETMYIGWQYFGSKFGAMRTYPGLHDNKPIDCRYRPWYVEGSTNPRYLLIMLDTSGSMYGYSLKLAKIVAEKIVQSLSEHDLANLILYNDTSVSSPSSCFKTLVRATPEVKNDFIKLIKGATAYGPDHITETITWAYTFLKSVNVSDCRRSLVILSDSTRKIKQGLIDQLDPDKEINILSFRYTVWLSYKVYSRNFNTATSARSLQKRF